MSYVGLGNAFGTTVVGAPLPGGFDAGKLPYCGTVRALQTTLGGLGYDVGKVDGKWGTNTAKGATAFAQAKGLNVSGGITKNFCAALQSDWVATMAPTPPQPTPSPPAPNGAKPKGEIVGPGAGVANQPKGAQSEAAPQTPALPPPAKAGLSTGAKIGIGLGAVGVLGAVAYFATRTSS